MKQGLKNVSVPFGLLFILTAGSLQANAASSEIYEAENAQRSERTIIDSQHAGFTGTGFVDYKPNEPGSSIEWEIEVSTEGEYTLEFRYGNGSTNNRPGEVRVNDDIVEEELAFDPTGEWASWDVTQTTVDLSEGANTIRLTGTGPSGGANIDHLNVYEGPPRPDQEEKTTLPDIQTVPLTENIDAPEFQAAVKDGLLMEEGDFFEESTVSRIEWMAWLNRLFDLSEGERFVGYEDPSGYADRWYTDDIQTAIRAGYVEGYPDERLLPEETITRQEAAVMLARLLDVDLDPSAVEIFSDADQIPKWSKGWIGAVISEGLISEENAFRATAPLQRGEAQAIADRLVKGGHADPGSGRIQNAYVVAEQGVLVVLDRYYETLNPGDVRLYVAQGDFSTLNPDLQPVTIKQASTGVNRLGQSVILYEIEPSLNEAAKLEMRAPKDEPDVDEQAVVERADHLVTWQLDHGGWSKDMGEKFDRPWDGNEERSVWMQDGQPLGTIDDGATISEIKQVAEGYKISGEPAFKESVRNGIRFLFKLQVPSGGFAQVYPQRGDDENDEVYYSNYVTFNDDAMIRTLRLMDDIVQQKAPFDTDVVDEALRAEVRASIGKGLDYILQSQIVVDGQHTAWGAQHDPVTYEPRQGRSYELPSIAAKESVQIIKWLMNRPNPTEKVDDAVRSALKWLDQVRVDGVRYVRKDPEQQYFIDDEKAAIWYRFYEIGSDRGIFAGRDGIKKYDILEIEAERRHGYSWAGLWPQKLLETARTYGPFEQRVYANVVADQSRTRYDRSLEQENVERVDNYIE